ncbi:DUF4334 domain-containing protein [Microcella frigidaquae]|uniref:GXWXG protein n=1 Tax=Microcella frigidaquae TaxID=424758 RepID=A0A840XLV9_9MICO|nr:hypothetical protein [Microcella frigidaquae]NHN43672.1 DUF4334 domain-containing protein [Microcella frigidaquae]
MTDPAAAHRTLASLEQGAALSEALAFYDTLAPVAVPTMVGDWRGAGIPTGGPFDGLLENLGWHGKRFDSAESVHPLVFVGARGRLVNADPGRVPLGLAARHGQRFTGRATAIAFRALLPLLATRRPRARLRPVEYRGVTSAAMSYDQLPIIDVFRAVDDDTLVGAMDLRGLAEPYLFTLRRERPASAL